MYMRVFVWAKDHGKEFIPFIPSMSLHLTFFFTFSVVITTDFSVSAGSKNLSSMVIWMQKKSFTWPFNKYGFEWKKKIIDKFYFAVLGISCDCVLGLAKAKLKLLLLCL